MSSACEHPTENVLEIGHGRRRYTCTGCGQKRFVEGPTFLVDESELRRRLKARSPTGGRGRL